MDVEAFHERLKELYLPPTQDFTLVDVPEIRFAVIDGEGNPERPEATEAMKWLYAVVHVVKPLVKKRMGRRFVQPPLECLCWADDWQDFVEGNRERWKWRVMVPFIDWISEEHFEDAITRVSHKRGAAPPSLRLENLHEGESVQIMHVGDYGEIRALCDRLYSEFLPAHRLKPRGYYHEIYLNDPSRTDPSRRKTVIRQPVERS